ncbi:MDR family oxidoreductase [Hydrogenophaga sp.]|uniref:acrylyl-CoA reductase (NADPH) n=1 Tax=Hydrogenophaga sp. TaxID=1904254 RepID=UPI002C865C2A|nr:MDR family oxidoreductase [Hydrogenophaga sp.]HMP09486.1 MDR family oxidoreductase [Hydrogenophaga sp.]
MFKGLLLELDGKKTTARLTELQEDQLPNGEVTVAVEYSTLNYKDCLAITGRSPVVRSWPMVPGIDFAGTVLESASDQFKAGDKVVLNGWGVGETRWGGLAQKARVPASFLIRLPDVLSPRDAMAIGTAGYTAMLAVQALERNGVQPDAGEILVTGANGGVGSFAIAILAKRGYRVVASTGRPEEAERLKALGAGEVIDRRTLSEPGKPLQKERWVGAVDCVGSHTLVNVCASTKYGGIVTACGLAQGMDFPASVAPFILRGVTLIGVDSVMLPAPKRQAAWDALAKEVALDTISSIARDISLEEVESTAHELLEGKVKGRVVVALS